MGLNLHVVNKPNEVILDNPVKQFVEEGGSIGRAEHCDLFLPDDSQHISKIHALIHFRDNMYFITDVSTNGVFVNNDSVPIGKGNTKQLLEGEKLHIGDYVIQASFQAGFNSAEKLDKETVVNNNDNDDIDALLNSSDDISDLLDVEVNQQQISKDNIVGGEELSVDDLLAGLDAQQHAGKQVQQVMDSDDDINALLADDELDVTPGVDEKPATQQDVIDVMAYSADNAAAESVFQATLLALDSFTIEHEVDEATLLQLKQYLLERKDQIIGSN